MIQFYKVFISIHLGPGCRFEPSCSTYAKQAFEKHNVWCAFWLTIKRLSKCRPGGAYGIDPVPHKGCSDHG